MTEDDINFEPEEELGDVAVALAKLMLPASIAYASAIGFSSTLFILSDTLSIPRSIFPSNFRSQGIFEFNRTAVGPGDFLPLFFNDIVVGRQEDIDNLRGIFTT